MHNLDNVKNLRDLVDYAAESFGDRPAYRYFKNDVEEVKTFTQFRHDIYGFAAGLRAKGFDGKHIAILGPTTYLFAVTFQAVTASNNVAVTIDIRLPQQDIVQQLEKADVTAVIYDSSLTSLVDQIREKVNFIDTYLEMESGIASVSLETYEPWEIRDDHALCLIMFTSGTSGKSKGVMMHSRGLTDNAIANGIRTGFGSDDRFLSSLPMYHIASLSDDMLWGLCTGACVCIVRSVRTIFSDGKHFGTTCAPFVPMFTELLYKKMCSEMKKNPALTKEEAKNLVIGEPFRTITTGAAPLSETTRKAMGEFGIRMVEQYGMTETHCNIATSHGFETRTGSCGKLLKGFTAKITDGQLMLHGDMIMMGYYKEPEITAEVLDADGWFATGDLAEFDADGYLYLKGRKKLMILLSNGENVSVEKIEHSLLQNENISEVVVYQKQDAITAQVYPNPETTGNLNETEKEQTIRKAVADYNSKNPVYLHVQRVELRDTEFPKTSSNKIKRAAFLNQ